MARQHPPPHLIPASRPASRLVCRLVPAGWQRCCSKALRVPASGRSDGGASCLLLLFRAPCVAPSSAGRRRGKAHHVSLLLKPSARLQTRKLQRPLNPPPPILQRIQNPMPLTPQPRLGPQLRNLRVIRRKVALGKITPWRKTPRPVRQPSCIFLA